MAYTTTQVAPGARSHLGAFFGYLGQAMNAYVESRSRQKEIAALEAKSDEELARMGLTRDRIIAHVFRDVLWL